MDSVSAGNPVQLTNSVIAQDQALPNDEDAHHNLRRYVAPKKESGDSEEEERAGFQWLSKLKTRFGKNPNVAKTLEKKSDLALALQKNPQVIKQIEDLQKKPGFIQRIANNPAMGKLTGRLAKNPVKFNKQNLRNIGRMAAKTTTRDGESLGGHKIYISLGIFVLLVFFIGGPALMIPRKSG
ncbi:hypothetical protein P3T76_013823 [Phytophthora citrophthora]|uniref:RxLR effector protein n=1 Tax=Phytophthora citrophthora TaxID=4793 RepID=A0AAD9G336_9STRA|nr:hypothetical protein P3T76_013823 [Phytophthora citrophthora]